MKVSFNIGILVYVAGNAYLCRYNLLYCRFIPNLSNVQFTAVYNKHKTLYPVHSRNLVIVPLVSE